MKRDQLVNPQTKWSFIAGENIKTKWWILQQTTFDYRKGNWQASRIWDITTKLVRIYY